MRKLLNILVLAVVAGGAIGYFTLGPSVFLGGPTKDAIIHATRTAMINAAASPEEDTAAQTAEITPQGLCGNNADGSKACMVEIEVTGAAPKTLITIVEKDATGTWVPVP